MLRQAALLQVLNSCGMGVMPPSARMVHTILQALSTILAVRFVPRQLVACLSMQDLLLALRMWPFMPAELLSECPMLPSGCPAPSAGAFTGSDNARSVSTAGAAFMTAQHLRSLSGVLADASASHPRIHSVWLTLLSLLIPGFTPVKVRK